MFLVAGWTPDKPSRGARDATNSWFAIIANVVTLVVGVVSLAVAIYAYREAQASGEAQIRSLNAQVVVLNTSRQALERVVGRLDQQLKRDSSNRHHDQLRPVISVDADRLGAVADSLRRSGGLHTPLAIGSRDGHYRATWEHHNLVSDFSNHYPAFARDRVALRDRIARHDALMSDLTASVSKALSVPEALLAEVRSAPDGSRFAFGARPEPRTWERYRTNIAEGVVRKCMGFDEDTLGTIFGGLGVSAAPPFPEASWMRLAEGAYRSYVMPDEHRAQCARLARTVREAADEAERLSRGAQTLAQQSTLEGDCTYISAHPYAADFDPATPATP